MKGSQLALVGAIFVIAIQPCYDVTGSVPNQTLVARKQVQATSRKETIFSNDSRPLSKSFEPIRIKVHYSLWEHLTTEEQNSLKQVIDRAVEKVQSILSGEIVWNSNSNVCLFINAPLSFLQYFISVFSSPRFCG